MSRYRLEDVLAKRAQKERDLQERLTKLQNKSKEAARELRKRNRATAGRILDRDGFLDLPAEEFNAGLHLWGVIRDLGLLSDPAEAQGRLLIPTQKRSAADSPATLALIPEAAE